MLGTQRHFGGEMEIKEKLAYWYYTAHWKLQGLFDLFYSMRAYFRKYKPRVLSAIDIQWAKEKGNLIDAEARVRATAQTKCNHKKGGTITDLTDPRAIAKGLNEGNSDQYSVRKHIHINGDMWVDCLRCGRKWKPPIRSEYRTEREFYRAIEEYEAAKNFNTLNATSASVQCSFFLSGDYEAGQECYRKLVAES
jgi:hypothetical protein